MRCTLAIATTLTCLATGCTQSPSGQTSPASRRIGSSPQTSTAILTEVTPKSKKSSEPELASGSATMTVGSSQASSGTLSTSTVADGGNHSEAVGVAPTVTLSGIWGGDAAIVVESANRIEFQLSDPDSDALQVAVELSLDSGDSWQDLACDNTSATGCDVDLSEVGESVFARLRLTASDADGNSSTVESSGDFGIAARTYTYLGDVEPLLIQNQACAPCHSDGGGNADALRWDEFSGSNGMAAQHERVRLRVKNGTMPPASGTQSLNTSEITKIVLWSLQGGDIGSNQAPSVTLLSPWNGGGTVTGANTGTITYQVSDPEGDEVSVDKVEYSDDGGSSWQEITCTALTSSSCAWGATLADDTQYRIRLSVNDARGASTTKVSATNFSIDLDSVSNSAPTVALSGVWGSGAAVVTGATTGTIAYTASDADNDPLTVTVSYSSDSGSTWSTITCANGQSTSSCQWNAAVPSSISEGDSYRVRVTVSDGHNAAVSDSSEADFGITNASYTYSGTIQTLLSTYCSSCHGASDGRFRPATYDVDDKDAYRLRDRISARMYDGNNPMPSSGWGAGDLDDRAKIQLWIWQGAPP